jgi:VanZ family protein
MEAIAVVALITVMLVVPWILAPAAASPFTSIEERRLWLWTLVVLAAIYVTMAPAPVLVQALRQRGLLGVVGVTILLSGGLAAAVYFARRRPGGREVGIALGVTAVYLMALLRIPFWEERTHLFEYGLVAILIYHALLERRRSGRRIPVPAAVAIAATALLGWVDEGIQSLLPNRVYDLRDVGFNALAGLMAVTSSAVLARARRRDRAERSRRP